MISTTVKITPVVMLLSSDAHGAGPLDAAGGGSGVAELEALAVRGADGHLADPVGEHAVLGARTTRSIIRWRIHRTTSPMTTSPTMASGLPITHAAMSDAVSLLVSFHTTRQETAWSGLHSGVFVEAKHVREATGLVAVVKRGTDILSLVNTTPLPTLARHALRGVTAVTSLGVLGSAVLLAAPAHATGTPEGWSDPEQVDRLEALVAAGRRPARPVRADRPARSTLPALARGEKVTPGAPENEWFGGPRQGVHAADTVDPQALEGKGTGGASGRW